MVASFIVRASLRHSRKTWPLAGAANQGLTQRRQGAKKKAVFFRGFAPLRESFFLMRRNSLRVVSPCGFQSLSADFLGLSSSPGATSPVEFLDMPEVPCDTAVLFDQLLADAPDFVEDWIGHFSAASERFVQSEPAESIPVKPSMEPQVPPPRTACPAVLARWDWPCGHNSRLKGSHSHG